MEVFSYNEMIKTQVLIFCEKNEVKLQTVRLQKEQEREVIVAYVEGHVGHYLLCPSRISTIQKISLENSLDIDFPDGTRAIASVKLVHKGNVLFVWKIKWERDSAYADW